MKSIIIDDEELSHSALNRLLKAHPDIQVVAAGYSVAEGLDLIARYQPELVFLDVEMPDGAGFDLLQRVGKPGFYVIFITAFAKYAISAIRFGALDFLLKPISPEDLAGALQRARERKEEKLSTGQLDILFETLRLLPEKKLPSRIGIPTNEGIIYRRVGDIIRLEANQSYTEFFFAKGQKKVVASVNIGEYEDQFAPYRDFMRVHRSHLVNLPYVEKYVRGDGGYLVMQDGAMVNVSKNYKEELLNRLDRL